MQGWAAKTRSGARRTSRRRPATALGHCLSVCGENRTSARRQGKHEASVSAQSHADLKVTCAKIICDIHRKACGEQRCYSPHHQTARKDQTKNHRTKALAIPQTSSIISTNRWNQILAYFKPPDVSNYLTKDIPLHGREQEID